MPKYLRPRPRVRLELTPRWWGLFLAAFSSPPASRIHAIITAYALGLHPVKIILKRSGFFVVVEPDANTTLETLCERAQRVIDQLNTIDTKELASEIEAIEQRLGVPIEVR